MLITESDVNVAVPATMKQLSKRRALLCEDREASVPQIVELEPRDTRIIAGALPGPAQAIRMQGQARRSLGG
nr:MAG TPA: hypothetical protein [Caudoviricetes sp.]